VHLPVVWCRPSRLWPIWRDGLLSSDEAVMSLSESYSARCCRAGLRLRSNLPGRLLAPELRVTHWRRDAAINQPRPGGGTPPR
jgi:hypothetical protein